MIIIAIAMMKKHGCHRSLTMFFNRIKGRTLWVPSGNLT